MGISLATSCIIFLSIISALESPFDYKGGIAKLAIVVTLSCVLGISGIFNGLSTHLYNRFVILSLYFAS